MTEYVLHCFAQSGNAYKPALMLELAAADWAPRFVDFFNGETRTPAYRAINVMGEVPVLEHGELRLSQSGMVLEYLAEKLGRFGAADAAERREILRWLLWDNHKLTSYTATYRFLRVFTEDPDPLYLGARLIVASLRRQADAEPAALLQPASPAAVVREAFVINVFNPKVALFFLAFLPQFVDAAAPSAAAAFVLLGCLFNVNSLFINLPAAWLAARAGRRLRASVRLARWLSGALGTFFVLLAARLATLQRQ